MPPPLQNNCSPFRRQKRNREDPGMSKGMTKFGAISLVLTLLAPFGAWAASDAVTSRMEAFRVTKAADGKETLEAAPSLKPGEVIEYQVTYENSDAAHPAKDLKVNVQVPPGTNYVDGSARADAPAQMRVSADAGKTWGSAPLKRKRADGRGEEEVPASQYSNLQWLSQEPLKQGRSQKYSYRVRIASTPAAHAP